MAVRSGTPAEEERGVVLTTEAPVTDFTIELWRSDGNQATLKILSAVSGQRKLDLRLLETAGRKRPKPTSFKDIDDIKHHE